MPLLGSSSDNQGRKNPANSEGSKNSDDDDDGANDNDDDDDVKPGTDTDPKVTGCKEGELKCEDKCVANDIQNCGECGHDCTELPHVGSKVDCVQNVCELTKSSCEDGWAHCVEEPDKGCETNITKAVNCGECGNDCTKTEKKLCTPKDDGYECAAGCPSAAPTLCGDSCVNTADSSLHCGKCGNVCESVTGGGPVCKNGRCDFECDSTTDLKCSDGCFPNDDEHCGDCENDCTKNNEVCDNKGNCVECMGDSDCRRGDANVCIKNECKQCEKGDCCDEDNSYRPTSYSCGPATDTEYQCSGKSACGAKAQKREFYRHCSGKSPDCDGNEEPENWQDIASCDEDELCKKSDNNASCEPCKNGCSAASGTCWSECNPDDDPCCEEDGTTLFCGYDPAEHLYWQHPKAPRYFHWQEAIDYCDDLSLGGHNDWRLPSKNDFMDMLGNCDSNIACNTCAESAACNAMFGSDDYRYWTSTTARTDRVWCFDTGDGYSNDYCDPDYDSNVCVRCVRSGP